MGVLGTYFHTRPQRRSPGTALTVLCTSPQHHQEDQLFGTRVPRRPKGKLRGLQRQPQPHGLHQQLFERQKEQRKVRGPESAGSLSPPEMSRDPDRAPEPGPSRAPRPLPRSRWRRSGCGGSCPGGRNRGLPAVPEKLIPPAHGIGGLVRSVPLAHPEGGCERTAEAVLSQAGGVRSCTFMTCQEPSAILSEGQSSLICLVYWFQEIRLLLISNFPLRLVYNGLGQISMKRMETFCE